MGIIPDKQFYVYTLSYPKGGVFYVGKGSGNRVDQHEQEAEHGHKCHKCNVIRKIWRNGGQVRKEIVYCTDNEIKAYEFETKLINEIGISRLTNRRHGGNGRFSALPFPDKAIEDISDSEYIRWARSQPGITPKKLKAMLTEWRKTRLVHLRELLRIAQTQQKLSGWDNTLEIEKLQWQISEVKNSLYPPRQISFNFG